MFHTPRQYRHTIAPGATLPNIRLQNDNSTLQPRRHLVADSLRSLQQ
jgi:hypothetical protein